jgi:hypothetical protein
MTQSGHHPRTEDHRTHAPKITEPLTENHRLFSPLLRHALGRRIGRQGHPGVARLLPHPDGRRGEIRIGEVADGNGDVSRKAFSLPVNGGPACRRRSIPMLRKTMIALLTTKIAISTRSKFIVAAAIAVLGLASPASAQSFNRPEGTGNSLPSYFDSQGGLDCGRLAACTGIPPQQIRRTKTF